jgi:hypothetical protein
MNANGLRAGLAALVLVHAANAPARADSISGSGAAFGVKAGSEAVTIFKTFTNGRAILHLRNVGSRTVKVVVTLQCDGGATCGNASTISIEPVARDRDRSRDQTLPLPASARTFTWTILT